MPKFQLTARLLDDATYDFRRQTLLDAASHLSPLLWEEPTSLIKFDCAGTAAGVHDYLIANSSVYRDRRDFVQVEEVTVHAYVAIGMKDEALYNVTTGTVPYRRMTLPIPADNGLPTAAPRNADLSLLSALLENPLLARKR